MISLVRQVGGILLLNGVQVPWKSLSISSNNNYEADTFKADVAVASLPKGLQRADISNLTTITAEIRFSLDGKSWTSMLTGVVDKVRDDFVGGTISLEGRDNTASFLDTKTTANFMNQTSSQVVQKLAAGHGFTADVTATSAKTGQYYSSNYNRLTDEKTEWDLLTFLAKQEGYAIWMTGTTVHFHPASQTYGTPVPIIYTPPTSASVASGNFISLVCGRELTLAGDVSVQVSSWNHKGKVALTATAKATKQGRSTGKARSQLYILRGPGKTKAQADALAQAKLEEISRHERSIELGLPADLTTTARSQIALSGTQTSYDQTYWVDTIDRSMEFDGGFKMTIKGKNHSPVTVITS